MLLASAILEQIPSSSFHLDWVSTFDQGRESMAKREHDVYLIDYMIGDHSGIELVRHARAELHRAPMILFDRQSTDGVNHGKNHDGCDKLLWYNNILCYLFGCPLFIPIFRNWIPNDPSGPWRTRRPPNADAMRSRLRSSPIDHGNPCDRSSGDRTPLCPDAVGPARDVNTTARPNSYTYPDLPPRVVPHPMLVPAPVEGREGRASSGTRATA